MWGLEAPEGVKASWSARAIHDGVGFVTLPDRRGFSEDPKETIDELEGWLVEVGLPALRAEMKRPYSVLKNQASRQVWRYIDPHPECVFTLHASCQGSYGYLYLGAWMT